MAEAELSSADFRGTLGRYALFGEIAAGGMATVHLARLTGSVGFSRTVAIKRLHPHLAKDPDFVAMFLEEARLAARVRHPHVVSTLDVVDEDNELFLVMEYIAGETLSRLVRKTREAGMRIPPRFVIAVMCATLEGLHAAHEATSERGHPLGIVHRDVSPQNIHVGLDGVARVLDFGIAKATNRVQETRTDQIKGKVAYMSPEQLAKGPIDRRADVYSASVVLWEALTGARLFKADDVPSLVYSIMNDELEPPSSIAPDLPKGLDAIVMKGLEREAKDRWSSAREMAVELEKVLAPAQPRDIAVWVRETAGELLAWRVDLVHRIESETTASILPPPRADSPSPMEIMSGVVANATPEAERDDATAAEADAERERDDAYHEASVRDAASRTATTIPPAKSRGWLALLAMALLVGGAGVLGLRLVQLQADVAVPAPVGTTSATSAAELENERAIVLGSGRPASSSSAAAASASASATAATPSAPTGFGVRPKPVGAAVPSGPKTVAPSLPADCEAPFTVDAKGFRHPKPYCFKR